MYSITPLFKRLSREALEEFRGLLRSKNDQHNRTVKTRQVVRADLFREQVLQMQVYSGEPRHIRRSMARDAATRAWKNRRTQA